jgi:signal transduction histidine kinase
VARLRAVQAATDVALAHLAADELLRELLGRLRTLLAADTAAVLLLDEGGRELVATTAVGLEEEVVRGVRVPLGQGFAGRVAAERRPLALAEVTDADVFSPVLREQGVASLLGAPLLLEGRLLGVVRVGTRTPRRFTDADAELLHLVADRLAVALDRARLFEAERAAHAAAATAVRERDEFLSVAAHELKTPITSLRGAAQLALRRLARRAALDPVQVGRTLELVDRQAARLNHLIGHLLDVARIEAGKLALVPEPTDLTHLVRSAIQLVPIDPLRHCIVVRAPAAPVLAVVDPLRLEQVLLNLLTNAVKYSPAGGEIELTLERLPAAVRVAVRDRGVGVLPDRRDQLFQRFYQAHGEGHLSGLGLGLYVSREIVALHGGTIAAEFPADGGTRFVVTLHTGVTPPAGSTAPTGTTHTADAASSPPTQPGAPAALAGLAGASTPAAPAVSRGGAARAGAAARPNPSGGGAQR